MPMEPVDDLERRAVADALVFNHAALVEAECRELVPGILAHPARALALLQSAASAGGDQVSTGSTTEGAASPTEGEGSLRDASSLGSSGQATTDRTAYERAFAGILARAR